jgi:hypothetical protein
MEISVDRRIILESTNETGQKEIPSLVEEFPGQTNAFCVNQVCQSMLYGTPAPKLIENQSYCLQQSMYLQPVVLTVPKGPGSFDQTKQRM